MISKVKSYLEYHTRLYGHYRFKEPIVVFESDDWGKINGVKGADYPESYGKRSDWSYDQLESEEELDILFQCLECHQDSVGRKAFFTSNFIISNPDFEKTIKNNYQKLELQPIDVSFPELLVKWREGIKKQVLFPQYHGRLHYNYELYQNALKEDEKTRYLFSQGINGGLENFDETGEALHSEYLNYEEGTQVSELKTWIVEGLREFERIFGFKSKSTIAPNYIIDPKVFDIFRQLGVDYFQGANKIWYKRGSKFLHKNYSLGTRILGGGVAIARTQKFEPCRKDSRWNLSTAKRGTAFSLSSGIPAVIDTHRINYVGQNAEKSRRELSELLESFKKFKDVLFLSSVELGEAIKNGGVYTDCFTQEKKMLTSLDGPKRKLARSFVH